MAIKKEIRTSNNGVLIKPDAPVYYTEEKIGAKAIKEDSKDNLQVTVNGVTYDGDTVAINYMSSVIAVANFKMINAMYQQVKMIPEVSRSVFEQMVFDTYETIYKQTIGWKGADNVVHQVQGESVAEALELAMGEVANIVGA
jgi:hypothetical protein